MTYFNWKTGTTVAKNPCASLGWTTPEISQAAEEPKSFDPERLPNEILLHIFRLAKNGRSNPVRVYKYLNDGPDGNFFEGDPNKVNPNEDHPLYKSLRQVSEPHYSMLLQYSRVQNGQFPTSILTLVLTNLTSILI